MVDETPDDRKVGLRSRLYGRARMNDWPLWIAWLLAGSPQTRKIVRELMELRKAGVDV